MRERERVCCMVSDMRQYPVLIHGPREGIEMDNTELPWLTGGTESK